MRLVESENHDSMTIVTFLNIEFTVSQVIVALLYETPNSPVSTFVVKLSWFHNVKKVDNLGDFKMNTLSNEAYDGINDFLMEYKLMISESALMGGGLLDRSYLLRKNLVGKHVSSIVKNMYLSDHDAVKIRIQKENREEIDRDTDFTIS